MEWWSRSHDNFFDDNIAKLTSSKVAPIQVEKVDPIEGEKRKTPPVPLAKSECGTADRHWKRPMKCDKLSANKSCEKLEEEPLKANDVESQGSILGSILLETGLISEEEAQSKTLVISEEKQMPQRPSVSVFQASTFVATQKQKFVKIMWGNLLQKIESTPLDSISSLKDEVQSVLDDVKGFDESFVSAVKKSLAILFANATAYDEVRSAASGETSKDWLSQQLSEARDRLAGAQADETM